MYKRWYHYRERIVTWHRGKKPTSFTAGIYNAKKCSARGGGELSAVNTFDRSVRVHEISTGILVYTYTGGKQMYVHIIYK
jgi:hypothetical protein